MAQQGGGAVRKKLASSSAAADAYTGEDRISALPDDLLMLILLRLPTTAEAVRTSILSHRWCPVWKRLPRLDFDNAPDLGRIRKLIDVPDPDPEALTPPELWLLSVSTKVADPKSAEAWLPAAARRVTGVLVFHNHADEVEAVAAAEAQERGIVQLPCFTKARGIELDLGFLELALPSTGTFARLTEIRFFYVVFQRPCQLGDVVSSPRCPSLRRLLVEVCHGIDSGELTIRSESLRLVHLAHLVGFQGLAMVTPALQRLAMDYCLENYYQKDYENDQEDHENDQEDYEDDGDNGGGDADADVAVVGGGGGNYPTVHITAPQLQYLGWEDWYDPQYVHFGNVEQLKQLRSYVYVYLQQDNDLNENCIGLLQRFQVLKELTLLLIFEKDLAGGLQYAMGDITMLPKIVSLKLSIHNKSHAFGACCFHLLRMCTSIQKLTFQFFAPNLELPNVLYGQCSTIDFVMSQEVDRMSVSYMGNCCCNGPPSLVFLSPETEDIFEYCRPQDPYLWLPHISRNKLTRAFMSLGCKLSNS